MYLLIQRQQAEGNAEDEQNGKHDSDSIEDGGTGDEVGDDNKDEDNDDDSFGEGDDSE